MAQYSQENRIAKITTPLGDDKLLLDNFSGNEELSRPFSYRAACLSTSADLDLDKVLGKEITIELKSVDGNSTRYFSGICTEASQVSATNFLSEYSLVLEPWFRLLDNAEDCKVFQNKSVADVIRQVFSDGNFADYKISLSGSYEAMPYCLQYNETTFDFLSRLMEENGIYYYFKHSSSKHEMQIVDAMSAHSSAGSISWLDYLNMWSLKKQLHTCKTAVNSYDFKNPSGDLQSKKSQSRSHGNANLEKYHFHANEYFKGSQGSNLAQIALEKEQAYYDFFHANCEYRIPAPGMIFSLKDCPRSDQNRDYLIVGQEFSIDCGDYVTQENIRDVGKTPSFNSSIRGIPSSVNYRPALSTPRPLARGLQSAVVVGKEGEEVWTDEFRRIKVQFPWDRVGEKNDKSSCWLRVAEMWAGKNFGSVFTPRVGQEVIVQFIDGNIDRPIVVGGVYNNDNKPPYGSDKSTVNGIRTHSTKEGGSDNYNELYFDDKKGEEKVYFQAEKDNELLVKNDRTTTIKHDDTYTVENDRKGTVKNDETLVVENDRSRTVKNDETIVVENDRKKTVKNDEIIVIENDRTSTVKNDESHTVENDRTKTVKGNESNTVENNRSSEIKGNDTSKVEGDNSSEIKGSDTQKVTGSQTITVSSSRSASITEGDKVSAQTIELSGKQSIKLSVGGCSLEITTSSIVLTCGGSKLNLAMAEAKLSSVQTTVEGTGQATLTSSGMTSVKGSMSSLKGDAMAEVNGAVTMIN